MSSDETVKITSTVPVETREWLRERYPDATSDSARVVMAIQDARDLEMVLSADSTVVLENPSD